MRISDGMVGILMSSCFPSENSKGLTQLSLGCLEEKLSTLDKLSCCFPIGSAPYFLLETKMTVL